MIKQQAVKLTNTCGGADENAYTHVCNPAECQSIVKYDCMCAWVNIHAHTHTYADIHRHTHHTYAHHTHTPHSHNTHTDTHKHTHRHTHKHTAHSIEVGVVQYRGSTLKTDQCTVIVILMYSHACILEKEKNEKLSSLPPSMEGQTHLTLGKKRRENMRL